MIQNIIAVVVGLAAGMTVNMSLILLNGKVLYPMPKGMDMKDSEQMNAYVATLPWTAILVVIVAHLGQAFVGGWVAARMGESCPLVLAMIVGAISLAGGIMMMRSVKGPKWMMIELPLYLVVAYLAAQIEIQRLLELTVQ